MIDTRDQETIIALCSPSGPGALALLRLSGAHAVLIASTISRLASGKTLPELPTHTIHLGWVIDHLTNDPLDQVMFMLMRAPKTFTGQDTVEISCHNNPFLIEKIIQQAISAGARLAQEGEFSRRAFLHGKIDLLQAEAINELIRASNHLTIKQSLAQLEGSFSHWIVQLEERLIKSLAFTQASFEFLDEEADFSEAIKSQLHLISADIKKAHESFDQQKRIREGFRISLIGAVNAGKSSLFNALLGKNRAIVTPHAGTTRDVIEAGAYWDFGYVTLIDTAGLRQTDDIIEQEGIKRSWHEAEQADLLLLVFDGARALTPQEESIYTKIFEQYQTKTILVQTKADLQQLGTLPSELTDKKIHQVSLSDQNSLGKLKAEIAHQAQAAISENNTPFLLNKRHYNLLKTADQHISLAVACLEGKNPAYELVTCHLQDALEVLSEFSGKTISERGMDAVFREFCVGK